MSPYEVHSRLVTTVIVFCADAALGLRNAPWSMAFVKQVVVEEMMN